MAKVQDTQIATTVARASRSKKVCACGTQLDSRVKGYSRGLCLGCYEKYKEQKRAKSNRHCLNCGKPYKSSDQRKKYCSFDCFVAKTMRDKTVMVKCFVCGIELRKVPSKAHKEGRDCCSDKCQHVAAARAQDEKRHGPKWRRVVLPIVKRRRVVECNKCNGIPDAIRKALSDLKCRFSDKTLTHVFNTMCQVNKCREHEIERPVADESVSTISAEIDWTDLILDSFNEGSLTWKMKFVNMASNHRKRLKRKKM